VRSPLKEYAMTDTGLTNDCDAATRALLGGNAEVDLATVNLEVLNNQQPEFGSYGYGDSVVAGLTLVTRGEYLRHATWHFAFGSGIARQSAHLGNYPEVSLDEARTMARDRLAVVEAQMAPPTPEEIAAYDLALAALKSGDQRANAEVRRRFLRFAQVPQDRKIMISPDKLPPAEALLTPVTALPLSTRTRNCCLDNCIYTVAQVIAVRMGQLAGLPGFGRKSLAEFGWQNWKPATAINNGAGKSPLAVTERTAEMARVMVATMNQFRAFGADDAHIIRFLRHTLEEMTGEERA
jgi:Bacterial RNA polymerase, alpha chain C terminal domain